MGIFQDLQASHEALLRRQQSNEPVLNDVKAYIEQARAASSQVADPRERDQLRANLRYWAGYVFDQEKIYPNVELAPSAAPPPKVGGSLMVTGAIVVVVLVVVAAVAAIGIGLVSRFPAGRDTSTPTFAFTASTTSAPNSTLQPTATVTPTPLPASPTPTPTPELPTLLPAPSQTVIPQGIFAELVSPQDGQAVKPREQIVVRYGNLQPGWSLHVLLQPLSQGGKFFPAKSYLTVTADNLSGEWSPPVVFEIGGDLGAPQQYSIQLVLAIDEATLRTLNAGTETGLQTLPPLTIRLPKVTTVTRGAYKSVVEEDRLLFSLLTNKGNYVLFTAKPDGSDAHQLLSPGIPATLNTREPSLSPSGQQVVFIGTEIDPAQPIAAIYSLWVMDSNGENARPIVKGKTGEAFERPLWSPDGRYIAYTLIASGDRSRSKVVLYDWQKPEKSPYPVPLGNLGSSFPAWFPGRDHLAFAFSAFTRTGLLGLLRYDLDTGVVTPVLDANGQATEPVVSPDGKSITFMLYTDPAGDHDLYVLDLATGKTRLVTKPHTGLNQSPCWSPDNQQIYFMTFRKTGRPDIWTVNKDGSNEHPVVEDMYTIDPCVGRLVAFFPLR